jgi:hypothetical protein
MGGRLFGGADHGWQDVGMEGGAWTLSQAVSGSSLAVVAGLEALRRTMPSASGRCPSTSGVAIHLNANPSSVRSV